MKPYNNSPVLPKKTRISPKRKVAPKRKRRPGMFSKDRTGAKDTLVPVGNTAPWTTNVGVGGKTSSGANKPRSAKKPAKKRKTQQKPVVRNKAPRARTPIMGNTNNAGMWGM